MKNASRRLRTAGFALVIGALTTGCAATRPENTNPPKFVSFTVDPQVVRTNVGIPQLRMTWSVSGRGRSEVTIRANNVRTIRGQVFDEVGQSAGFDGMDSYTRVLTVDLRDFFTAIPPTLDIEAVLREHHDIGTSPPFTERDRRSERVTTQPN